MAPLAGLSRLHYGLASARHPRRSAERQWQLGKGLCALQASRGACDSLVWRKVWCLPGRPPPPICRSSAVVSLLLLRISCPQACLGQALTYASIMHLQGATAALGLLLGISVTGAAARASPPLLQASRAPARLSARRRPALPPALQSRPAWACLAACSATSRTWRPTWWAACSAPPSCLAWWRRCGAAAAARA